MWLEDCNLQRQRLQLATLSTNSYADNASSQSYLTVLAILRRAWSVYTLLPDTAAMPRASSGNPRKPRSADAATRRYRARTAVNAFTICTAAEYGAHFGTSSVILCEMPLRWRSHHGRRQCDVWQAVRVESVAVRLGCRVGKPPFRCAKKPLTSSNAESSASCICLASRTCVVAETQ